MLFIFFLLFARCHRRLCLGGRLPHRRPPTPIAPFWHFLISILVTYLLLPVVATTSNLTLVGGDLIVGHLRPLLLLRPSLIPIHRRAKLLSSPLSALATGCPVPCARGRHRWSSLSVEPSSPLSVRLPSWPLPF